MESENYLTHHFKDFELKFEYKGGYEKQPGLFIEHAKISSNKDELNLSDFVLGIKDVSEYSFGYKNWIFIPESDNYYLLNIETGEKFNHTVWFRENGKNTKDYLVKNYFESNKHYTINKRSKITFDLNTFEKAIEK